MAPHFSIVIPAYNAESTIRKCLDSVLNQTFHNFECIIVNDGSKDKTANVVKEFIDRDKRFFLINQENGGVSKARNTGIKNANGKYIIFIDSDDYISSIYLRDFTTSSCDLIISGVNIFSNHNELLRSETYQKKTLNTQNHINDILIDFINRYSFKTPWAKAFRRSLIINNDLKFNDNVHFGEDTLFNLIFLKHAQSVEYLSSSGYNYIEESSNKIYNFNCRSYKISISEFLIALDGLDLDSSLKEKIQDINKTLYYCIFYSYFKSQLFYKRFNLFFKYYMLGLYRFSHHKGFKGKLKTSIELIKLLFKK